MIRFLTNNNEMRAKLEALDKSQALIEFSPDGHILTANRNFLAALGYTLPEIVGQHHSMFVEPGDRNSPEYAAFWAALKRGEYQTGQYKRIGKNGREVWIEASYNPLLDGRGKLFKVVKFAIDITRRKAEDADRAGQIAAINKVQAVITFDLDGNILDANENFLRTVGYTLPEIRGRHHSIFVLPHYRESREYAEFWAALKRGEYQAAQYKRIGKGGREIWIEASYNPILDASGRPYKVVKFATDVTQQVTLLHDLQLLIDRNFGEVDRAMAQSNRESEQASRLAQSTSGNVHSMAAATEELAASVAEIAHSMANARAATDTAFMQAQTAGAFTQRLSDAATAMGNIVSLIQTIAAQINLLALNATIESARAGAAGRGFAVVAQEVKNLASQAARATEQITDEIEAVRTASSDVVGALDTIRSSVEDMRNNIVTTAVALDQQNTVTQEMSSSMQGAARSVADIVQNISAISDAVGQVSVAVTTTKEAAKVLVR